MLYLERTDNKRFKHMGSILKTLSENELHDLYNEFVIYRDTKCNGWSDMSIEEFYKKNKKLLTKKKTMIKFNKNTKSVKKD